MIYVLATFLGRRGGTGWAGPLSIPPMPTSTSSRSASEGAGAAPLLGPRSARWIGWRPTEGDQPGNLCYYVLGRVSSGETKGEGDQPNRDLKVREHGP